MVRESDSGSRTPQGVDPFAPTTQLADFADDESRWNNLIRVANAAARNTLAAPELRDGILVQDLDTHIIWHRVSGAWIPIISPWTSWTPTLTNFSLGSSPTSVHKWRYRNGLVLASGTFTFGAGFAFTGAPQLSLPMNRTTLKHAFQSFKGTALAYDVSALVPYYIAALTPNTDVSKLQLVPNASGAIASAIGASTPFAWAAGDSMSYEVEYEPA